MRNLLLFIILTGGVLASLAQSDSIQGNGLVILPMYYYTPETGHAFGVGGLRNFYLGKDTSNRDDQFSSYYKGKLIYTQNKQYEVSAGAVLFSKGNVWQFQNDMDFMRFPMNFYGVGNEIDPNLFEQYDAQLITFNNKLVRNITGDFYAGLQNQFKSMFNVVAGDKGLLNENIVGSQGGISSGLGLSVRYDTRDNANSSRKGIYTNFELVQFAKIFSSDYTFTHTTFDIRAFKTLHDKLVFAAQYYHNLNFGTVPFFKLAALGGDQRMRGYYSGMFRDQHYAVSQVEFRYLIFKNLSLVTFVGAGGIGEVPSEISESLKYSFGGGFRWFVKGTDRLCIRFDYGRTLEDGISGNYVTVSEAF